MPEAKNISLTPEQAQQVEDRVQSGRYQNASEVVQAGLRLLDQEDQRRLLQKWLLEGLTPDEEDRLNPELLSRSKKYIEALLREGMRSGEEDGWIDGPSFMKELRGELTKRLKDAG